MSIPRFSFYRYVDEIKELVSDHFPIFETVSFSPSDDGDDKQYSDVGVPAFLMSFQAPDFVDSVPMRDVDADGGGLANRNAYYADIQVNVTGSLLLPRFKVDPQNDDDLNMSIAVFQAASNIAALIHAKARGWNCDPAVIGNIRYEPDENYHVGIIEWSHRALVGREDSTVSPFGQGFGRFLEDIEPRDTRVIIPALEIEDVSPPIGGETHYVVFRWFVFDIATVDDLTDKTYVDISNPQISTDNIMVTHTAGETKTEIDMHVNLDGVGTFEMPTPTVVGEKVEIVVRANAIAEGNVETKKDYVYGYVDTEIAYDDLPFRVASDISEVHDFLGESFSIITESGYKYFAFSFDVGNSYYDDFPNDLSIGDSIRVSADGDTIQTYTITEAFDHADLRVRINNDASTDGLTDGTEYQITGLQRNLAWEAVDV